MAAANESCRVAFVGDSLTAGFGLDEADTWPTRMAARMRDAGFDCAVINAGVSGDTTAGGKARIGWVLFDEPSHVVLALGANDGLRGLPVEDMARNLSVMIRDLHAADVHVLLAGMLAPPNMGPAYVERYEAAFRTVAAAHEVAFVPFLLDGIAARPELNQADGIHPNAAGVAVMVERTWPVFEQWLEATLPDA
ncbi:MAG: arylesterase [Geminicoccaceae bacterium]|nr:MAG: arylesterase [Geminicoccaceae bacterium]